MKVLKFSAGWCGPCQIFAPIFNRVCSLMKLNCVAMDVERNAAESATYNVTSLPTTIIVDDNGVELDRRVGALDDASLEQFISSYK